MAKADQRSLTSEGMKKYRVTQKMKGNWSTAITLNERCGHVVFLKKVKSPVSFFYSAVPNRKQQENEDDEIEETPQEKKLRLAKLYLDQLREEGLCKMWNQAFTQNLTIVRWTCFRCAVIGRGQDSRARIIWSGSHSWKTSGGCGRSTLLQHFLLFVN